MLKIGPYRLQSRLLLAPMAGITDRPYRELCWQFGAGLTSSEMVTSDLSLLKTKKTQLRLPQKDEASPRSIQIVGTDPELMAESARFNEESGAQIIDINMGCPAKKVCSKAAGSALMQDPSLIKKILTQTVNAVNIPVTLKMRTGWSHSNKNALKIAKIAEQAGVSSLAVHGRTRDHAYTGFAEYETIRQIKQAIDIPVLANGDIKTKEDALFIFDYTGVDGLMLGRISHGQPWIFKELNEALVRSTPAISLAIEDKITTIMNHISAIHRYYGTDQGVRIARKHIGWYLLKLVGRKQDVVKAFTREIFPITCAIAQLAKLNAVMDNISTNKLYQEVLQK